MYPYKQNARQHFLSQHYKVSLEEGLMSLTIWEKSIEGNWTQWSESTFLGGWGWSHVDLHPSAPITICHTCQTGPTSGAGQVESECAWVWVRPLHSLKKVCKCQLARGNDTLDLKGLFQENQKHWVTKCMGRRMMIITWEDVSFVCSLIKWRINSSAEKGRCSGGWKRMTLGLTVVLCVTHMDFRIDHTEYRGGVVHAWGQLDLTVEEGLSKHNNQSDVHQNFKKFTYCEVTFCI